MKRPRLREKTRFMYRYAFSTQWLRQNPDWRQFPSAWDSAPVPTGWDSGDVGYESSEWAHDKAVPHEDLLADDFEREQRQQEEPAIKRKPGTLHGPL